MKAWLKGGIIGIIVLILMVAVLFSFYLLSNSNTICPGDANCYYNSLGKFANKMMIYIGTILAFPINSILNIMFGKCYQVGCIFRLYLLFFLVPFQYFLLGALIGWIIEKIISKR